MIFNVRKNIGSLSFDPHDDSTHSWRNNRKQYRRRKYSFRKCSNDSFGHYNAHCSPHDLIKIHLSQTLPIISDNFTGLSYLFMSFLTISDQSFFQFFTNFQLVQKCPKYWVSKANIFIYYFIFFVGPQILFCRIYFGFNSNNIYISTYG